MADKEIKVKVTTEADISGLEDLSEVIKDIKEDANIDFKVDADTSSLDDAEAKSDNLQESLDKIHLNNIDAEEVANELNDTIDKAESLNNVLDGLGTDIGIDIDTTIIDDAKQSLEDLVKTDSNVTVNVGADTSDVDALSKSIADTKESTEILNDAISTAMSEVENRFADATSEVERLQDALDEANFNGDDIEADRLADELHYAEEEAEKLGEALENITSGNIEEINADELAESLDNASSSAESLSDSLNNVDSNNISDTSSSAEELADGLDNASSSAEDLSSSLGGIDSGGLSDATSGAEELTESLDNATSSSEGLSESMGLIDATLMLSTAQQLGQYGAQAEGLAQDMNTAAISVGQLATQAGIAESQMIGLVSNISNATFPQEEAMQYIQLLDQLGVSVDKLGSSATNMDRINDAFHIGSNNVANLTGNLYALGVPADNLESSFNALGYAQSNVAGGVDKFNTVLQRLGPSFSEYGFNVDQAAIITAGATHQWGTGRKAMTNLSNALKEANGDTRALEEALGLETGALDNASQITGQYAGQVEDLAAEEAEHKTLLEQLGAVWEDLSLQLSPVLEPMSSFMGIIGQAGSYAVGINGIITLTQTLREAEIAQWLLNIAMSANPITIVVLAIIALIAVLGYLYFNNEQVRAAIDALGQSFYQIGSIIYSYLIQAFDMIVSTLQGVWDYIFTLGGLLPAEVDLTGNQIINSVLRVMAFLFTLPAQIGIIFMNIIARALGFKGNFVQNLVSAATSGVSGFVNAIQSIPKAIQSCLDWARSVVLNHPIVQTLKWLGEQAAYAFSVVGLQQRSPGKIVKALRNELNWAEEAVRGSTLTNTIATLGADMSNEFNPNLNTISNASSNIPVNNGGDIIVNVYGDIDNDKRIRELVDAVRRELNWNNTTAGRTI